MSFRELQAELWNLGRETKKLQSQHKPKKTYAQVHVTAESGTNVKTDRTKHTSELSELNEMVKKLAHSQEEQLVKLSQLELGRHAWPLTASFSERLPRLHRCCVTKGTTLASSHSSRSRSLWQLYPGICALGSVPGIYKGLDISSLRDTLL